MITSKSESIVNISKALIEAQAEMPVVQFDAKNPYLKYSYATLGSIISVSKPILKKHGLGILQFPISQEGRVGVETILLHESGEFFSNSISLVPEVGKGLTLSQAAGIIITYLRRYSRVAVLDMYADEDGDGENLSANAIVADVMSGKTDGGVDQNTGEIKHTRTWSFQQMDALLESSAGIAGDYEEAKVILDLSVMPDTVTPKAVASWFKHFLKAEGTNFVRAAAANDAYINAKSKK